MGGAAPVDSGKGGKKSMDSEINLVPFIDLLSCLISFLIVTAVWTQISVLKASSTGSLTADDTPVEEKETVDIKVTVSDVGYKLSMERKGGVSPIPLEVTEIPKIELAGDRRAAKEAMAKELSNANRKVKREYVFGDKDYDYKTLVGKLKESCSRFMPVDAKNPKPCEKGYPATQALMIAADDGVLFDELMATIDSLENAPLRFSSVSVAPSAL